MGLEYMGTTLIRAEVRLSVSSGLPQQPIGVAAVLLSAPWEHRTHRITKLLWLAFAGLVQCYSLVLLTFSCRA